MDGSGAGRLDRGGSAGKADAAVCDACAHGNPLGSRFCNACGAALGGPTVDVPRPRLPLHLENKIRAQRFDEGERKQITVLFADVVGSMDLAERQGAERWRALMDRLFALLCRGVHGYEGTVQDFTGDGIMALFGAPIAHEDHAQRACHAALQIIDELPDLAAEIHADSGSELSLRIGLNSGEVIVGAIGEDLRLAYTAIGHTVGLAQRMESLAEPGSVYLSDSTADLVSGYLELSDLGHFDVKGAAAPRHVFRLEGPGAARDKLERSRAGALSSFVGREDELQALEHGLDLAVGGEGQAFGLVAEAGTGKSRLAQEFATGCREQGIPVYEARTLSYGKALPLLPVKELLSAYFEIANDDPEEVACEKAIERALALDPGLERDLPLVLDLLDLADPERPIPSMKAEARQRRLLAAMRRLIVANGERGPSVTVVEDLHWVDPGSQIHLDNLVASLANTRSLVLLTFRPEYHPGWNGDLPYRELPLPPLEEGPLGELFGEILGDDRSLDGLAELLTEHTRGNPFFAEETVRELESSGALEGRRGNYRLVREIGQLEVPPSVQAVLAARVDRLEPASKSALQAAAVIGGEFGRELLARILDFEPPQLDAALAELLTSDLISGTATGPEPLYEFRHPLIREVVYESQLAPVRIRTHAAIARAIQELEPEQLDERAGLIAAHFEAAGEPFDAARWHARAGWGWNKDPAGAERHLRRVRALDPELPGDEEADVLRATSRLLLLSTASRLGGEAEEIRRLFEEGTEAAERSGNRGILALLYGVMAITVVSCSGDGIEGARLSDEATRIAEDIEEPALQIPAQINLVWPRWLSGRYEESLAGADRVLELTENDPRLGAVVGTVDNPRALAATLRALPLLRLGRLKEARLALAQGVELSERWYREALGQAHSLRCMMALSGADEFGDETLAHARRAVEVAEELGGFHSRVNAAIGLGGVQARLGDLASAERSFKRSLALIEAHGAGRELEPTVYMFRAKAAVQAGDFRRGVADGERALRLTNKRGVRALVTEVRRSLAETLIARGAGDDAERATVLLDEAEEGAKELGATFELATVARSRVGLYVLKGDVGRRELALEAAWDQARQIDARGLLAQLEAEVGSLRSANRAGGP